MRPTKERMDDLRDGFRRCGDGPGAHYPGPFVRDLLAEIDAITKERDEAVEKLKTARAEALEDGIAAILEDETAPGAETRMNVAILRRLSTEAGRDVIRAEALEDAAERFNRLTGGDGMAVRAWLRMLAEEARRGTP